MRFILPIVLLTFSSVVHATSVKTSMTCENTDVPYVTAKLEYTQFALSALTIKNGSDEMKTDNLDKTLTPYQGQIQQSELSKYSLLQATLKKAGIDLKEAKTVNAVALIDVENKSEVNDLNEALLLIEDDGAGIIVVTALDQNGKRLQTAAFLGWAGYYKNCQ